MTLKADQAPKVGSVMQTFDFVCGPKLKMEARCEQSDSCHVSNVRLIGQDVITVTRFAKNYLFFLNKTVSKFKN